MHNDYNSSRAVRTERYTFVVNRGQKAGFQLFDRQDDPWQMTSCAADKPEVCKELTEELDRWLKKTKDPWKEISCPIVFDNMISIVSKGDSFTVDLSPGQAVGKHLLPLASISKVVKDKRE